MAQAAADVGKPLRWGFLGCGWIADIIAKDFALAGLVIAAVGARSGESARAFAQTHGVPKWYEGYDGLVADPDVDIVYVSTPQNYHHRDAMRTIKAGKHLLLEKPFTLDAVEAAEVAAAATARGVFAMEAMWTRFLPSMVAAMEAIRSGAVGEPTLVVADHSQHLTAVPRLWDAGLGGGALLDLGVYPVSFIVSVLGVPSGVVACGVLTNGGVDETTSAVLTYSSHSGAGSDSAAGSSLSVQPGQPAGRQGVFTTSLSLAGPITATVCGTRGRLELGRSFYEHTTFTVTDNAGKVTRTYCEPIRGRGMQYEALHVEECVRRGLLESPVMPLGESVAIMAVLDQVRSQMGVVFKTHQV